MNEVDPIILYTDASLLGLGAMLEKGEEVPPMFVSKKFTSTQRNWSTIEQEAFAIFYSILQLQSFLLDRHFFVKTDHRNFGLFIYQYSSKSHSLATSVIGISVHCCPYPGRFKCSGRHHLSFFCS